MKPTVEQLSNEFSRLIREELTEEELEIVNRLNAKDRKVGHNVCHTHDFIDANMTMDKALQAFNLSLSVPVEFGEFETNEEVLNLLNEAWNQSARNKFQPTMNGMPMVQVEDFNGNIIEYNPQYLVYVSYGTWENGEKQGQQFKTLHLVNKTITVNI